MAHEVEQMFYVSNEENSRFVPWHKLGTAVAEAPNSAEALKLAGLDWEVLSKPVYTDQHIEIPNYKANTRSSDNSILGIVTDRYQIVQNTQAFDFTDSLIGENVRYETAGSLRNGKTVWLLAKMPQQRILDDKIDPYLCFTNSHDGFGSIRVCMANVRIVCNNTLNIALNTAQRTWSVRHTGDISNKLYNAQETLHLANKYNEELKLFAEKAANTPVSEDKTNEIISSLFPITNECSDRHKAIVTNAKKQFESCIYAVDLSNFYGTLWGLLNAYSDYAYHSTPSRVTSTMQEGRMLKCINGLAGMNMITEMATA